MTIPYIDNHIEAAKERLIEQYKDASNLRATLDAFNGQTQDIEDVFQSLYFGRWVSEAEGQVLDDFGTIVGQDRLGFEDDFYRILIYVRIGINISQGETERIVDIYKIITQATLAEIIEHYPAGMYLLSNGTIQLESAQFVLAQLQQVVAAGVRIDGIGYFSDTPFGFFTAPTALGFGDNGDPNVGGTFATLYDTALPFGFYDPSRKDIGGLGHNDDPHYGGKWSTTGDSVLI